MTTKKKESKRNNNNNNKRQLLQADYNMVFAISIGFVKREEEVSAWVGSSPSHIPLELFDNDAASARYLLSRSKTVTMQIKLSALPPFLTVSFFLLYF